MAPQAMDGPKTFRNSIDFNRPRNSTPRLSSPSLKVNIAVLARRVNHSPNRSLYKTNIKLQAGLVHKRGCGSSAATISVQILDSGEAFSDPDSIVDDDDSDDDNSSDSTYEPDDESSESDSADDYDDEHSESDIDDGHEFERGDEDEEMTDCNECQMLSASPQSVAAALVRQDEQSTDPAPGFWSRSRVQDWNAAIQSLALMVSDVTLDARKRNLVKRRFSDVEIDGEAEFGDRKRQAIMPASSE